MQRATISHTKNHLSALLERVRRGETVLILDRTVPVARLEPVPARRERPDDRLARLERAGLVRRGSGRVVEEVARGAPPVPKRGADIVKALLRERAESR